MSKDDYSSIRGPILAGYDPVISSTSFRKDFKSFTDLLLKDGVEQLRVATREGEVIVKASNASAIKSTRFKHSRALEAQVDISALSLQDLSPTELPPKGSEILLDPIACLLIQTQPQTIRGDLLSSLQHYHFSTTSATVRKVYQWIADNQVIKNTMRKKDFLYRLTEGLTIVDLDEDIMEESTLLENFKGTVDEQLLVATARKRNAFLATTHQALINYEFVNSFGVYGEGALDGQSE